MDSPVLGRLNDADYDDVIALTMARFPDNDVADAAVALGETFAAGRVVIGARDDDGALMGFAILWQPGWLPATEWVTRVLVGSRHEGAGLGSRLWSAIRSDVPPGTTALRVGVRDDEHRSFEVAKGWGFEVNVHSMESRLTLAGVELPPEPPSGVTIERCDDLEFADRPAVEQMFRACQTDPEALRGSAMTLDQMRTIPDGAAALNLLVRVDGVPAAITCAAVNGAVQWIYYTGVDPTFRGRGLAKLVKQHAHVHGAAAGATECRTTNVEENTGIRRINAELGYEVGQGIYRMVRHLA